MHSPPIIVNKPELSLDIIDLAGHNKPQRRLPVAHTPLHPENKQELDKCLIYCWLTLVRCNMFAQALGIGIKLKAEVIHSLRRVVGVPPGRMLFQENDLLFWYFQRYGPNRFLLLLTINGRNLLFVYSSLTS
ncbi:hypothetical protein BDW69DRAFT_4060 [Aspergillus filifer]